MGWWRGWRWPSTAIAPQDEYVIKDCRAVIREVAAALLEWHDSDQIVHTAWEAAKWLQQEANHD